MPQFTPLPYPAIHSGRCTLVSIIMVFVWIAEIFILTQTAILAMAAQQPNILFILTDDQSYDAVHALGGNEIQTPHIDRLAREGMTFTHAYNMGAWHGAVCVASRTMLNTGRFLWRAKAREKRLGQDAQQGLFWSQWMRQAGYQTYFSGKWHVQVDVHHLFDHGRVHHVRPGMPNQTEMGYNRPLENEPDRWKPWDKKRGGYWQGGRHWSEVVADDAVEYLQQASDDSPPFFMYIAFNAPHDPRQSPKEFIQRYPQAQIQIPDSFLPEYPYASAMGCGHDLRDERLAPFPRTPHAIQVHRQEYYAIITHLDEQIGRVLEALRQSGQAEHTYVLFTSDHGLAVGRHGLMGKQSMFDHSVRMPLIITGPDIPAGGRLSVPVYMQDVMPTTLELAGVQRSPEIEFHSLLPHIRASVSASSLAPDKPEAIPADSVNPTRSPYPAIYGAYRNLQRMITADNYKLILYPSIQKKLLFNLREDPEEIDDLAEQPAHQTTVRRLFAELRQLQKTMDDPLELGNVYPELTVK